MREPLLNMPGLKFDINFILQKLINVIITADYTKPIRIRLRSPPSITEGGLQRR
jgi:hypothetical protein